MFLRKKKSPDLSAFTTQYVHSTKLLASENHEIISCALNVLRKEHIPCFENIYEVSALTKSSLHVVFVDARNVKRAKKLLHKFIKSQAVLTVF